MGKIKTKLVKRTAETLAEKDISFTKDFETNKKILGDNMPSKKIRNQVAGLLSRMKKSEAKKKELLSNDQTK